MATASVTGGAGNDVITGGSSADTISGGSGNDTINGGAGADVIDGGAGADTIIVKAAVGTSSDSGVVVVSGTGNDVGADTIKGFAFGLDKIKVVASGVTDFVARDDVSVGTARASITVTNSDAYSALTGLISLDGNSTVNDTGDIAITFDSPTYETGSALDDSDADTYNSALPYADNFLASLVFDLTGTVSSDGIWGGPGADTIAGGAEADFIRGGRAGYAGDADLIFAGAATTAVNGVYPQGADTIASATAVAPAFTSLFSPQGDSTHYDKVFGGANIIEGAQGNDVLVASTAKDVFLYQTETSTSGPTPGNDTIHSFKIGTDRIFTFETDGSGNGSDYTFTGNVAGGGSTTTTGSLPAAQVATRASTHGWTWTLDAGSATAGTLAYTSLNPSAGASASHANFSIHLVGLLGTDGNALATTVTADSFFL